MGGFRPKAAYREKQLRVIVALWDVQQSAKNRQSDAPKKFGDLHRLAVDSHCGLPGVIVGNAHLDNLPRFSCDFDY